MRDYISPGQAGPYFRPEHRPLLSKTTPYLRPVFSRHERIRSAVPVTASCRLEVAPSIPNFSDQRDYYSAFPQQPLREILLWTAITNNQLLHHCDCINCFHTYEKSSQRMRRRVHYAYASRERLPCQLGKNIPFILHFGISVYNYSGDIKLSGKVTEKY